MKHWKFKEQMLALVIVGLTLFNIIGLIFVPFSDFGFVLLGEGVLAFFLFCVGPMLPELWNEIK